MKLYHLLLAAVSVMLFSCTGNNILNDDNIATQTFSLNINRDTTLLTKSRCIIKIPKGSLESDSANIKLEVKEAITNTDIVLGGLVTVSNKEPLSSGGMIYVNAADGYKVSIKKPLEVLIPTKDYDPAMSVFKASDSIGKANWTDPEPLPKDSTILAIEVGKGLFQANCANCHKPSYDYTGPALKGITKKRRLDWIYHFINNPPAMNDETARSVKEKWKPIVMTSFPNLTPTDINYILAYIETSPDRSLKPQPATEIPSDTIGRVISPCMDSCFKYRQALAAVGDKANELETEVEALENEEQFFTLDRTMPIPPQTGPAWNNTIPTQKSSTSPSPTPDTKEYVEPTSVKATFYTINIKSFGWYNVDILMKERSGCSPSELFVRLQGNYDADFQVMLIVPSVKAFVEGGKLKDGKQYGFDETNGKIPLPPNAQCYVIAFAEVGDKLIFGKAEFLAASTQTIDISFSETTKEGLQEQIKALKLDGIDTEVKDSEKAVKKAENSKIIEKISGEAEKLKPKNCNCDFMGADSARVAMH